MIATNDLPSTAIASIWLSPEMGHPGISDRSRTSHSAKCVVGRRRHRRSSITDDEHDGAAAACAHGEVGCLDDRQVDRGRRLQTGWLLAHGRIVPDRRG